MLARSATQRTRESVPNDAHHPTINATQLCQAAGKLFADYKRRDTTKEFLEEMSASMGIPIDALIEIRSDVPNHLRGTWVHPDVAVNLAQWLSARFAVLVSKWVRELMAQRISATVLFSASQVW
jgi:hypothetical protein